jgi:hypothetical protein
MMPQAVRAPNISPTGGEAPRRNRFVYGRLEGLTRRAQQEGPTSGIEIQWLHQVPPIW